MFGKKKPKLDPKVRFQHRQFTQKLDKARQFKRVARTIPENRFDIALTKVGLGSRWRQILAGLVVLAGIYLVYVPNFLSVQSIVITGVSDSNKSVVEAAVRQAIADANFYNPQHNLLFLTQSRVKSGALSVPTVFTINEVKKDFEKKTLYVDVAPKKERFLLTDTQRVYDIYNDGILKGESGLKIDQWQNEVNSGMVKLKIGGVLNAKPNEQTLQPQLKDTLETLVPLLGNLPGATFSYVLLTEPLSQEILPETTVPVINAPIASDELRVLLLKNGNVQRPFTVIFDAHSEITSAENRLNSLLSQTTPDRYNNISYIDMRLEDRGFICLVNTPCDK